MFPGAECGGLAAWAAEPVLKVYLVQQDCGTVSQRYGGRMVDVAGARAFLRDLPKLHYWNDTWQVGGLNPQVGDRLIEIVTAVDKPEIIETGAGSSTLLFLQLQPLSLTTIAPDAALRDRMLAEAEKRGIPTAALRFIADRSELVLPKLAADGETYNIAFIDGNHGWPAVFVDFCYLNYMLTEHGLLIVDDLHLYSCAQLYLLLLQQPEYELASLDANGKQATFRKITGERWLPDWRREPFIVMNSVTK